MKLFTITLFVLLTIQLNAYAQSIFTATIGNYPQKYIYAYQCWGDSLIFTDSIKTNEKGKFVFQFTTEGIYRFKFPRNQWFYILNDGKPIEIKTEFHFDMFNNLASDSLEVIKSDENKMFYKFQRIQQKIAVANAFLKEMMRLYPLQDPFHSKIEKEWLARYKEMERLFNKANKKSSDSFPAKVINAYYQPTNPDWREPDNWRDSIIAVHYFDYFHPAEEFYLNTNILPEKIDNYFDLFSALLRVNRETRFDYERNIKTATDIFLKHTAPNLAVHEFCLQYILKKLDKLKMYDALFSVYDKWVYAGQVGDCEQTHPALNQWREKVNVLRNIQIGSVAPDFEIGHDSLNLYQISANYILMVFWASWCPHCTEELPKIKKAIEDFQSQSKGKTMMAIFISLDNEEKLWKDFVEKNGLSSFTNLCDFKSWKGEIVKKYNVFATPSIFLLDKDKKINAKPEDVKQLINNLNVFNTGNDK